MKLKLFHISVNFMMALCFILVSGEIYSSVKELEKLITAQKSVTQRLGAYMYMKMETLTLLRGYLDKFKQERKKNVADIQNYVGNPMNRFLYIKRLTSDLAFIKELINNKSELDSDSNVTYPTQEDLTGAAVSVARLQETYLLDVHDLADGRLKGSPSTPMSANDCYELGRILYEDHHYEASKDWLLEAYRKVDPAEIKQNPVFVAKTIEALCFVYISLEDMENVEKWVKALDKLAIDSTFMTEVKYVLKMKKKLDSEEKSKKNLNISKGNEKYRNITRDFKRLCRREMELPQVIKTRLKCRYLMDNPFIKLAPLKMEQLYINPDVYLFYDVISDTEIEKIKTLGSPKLIRSRVKLTKMHVVSEDRISQNSWLSDGKDPIVDKIYSRVEDITGLSTRWSEKIQLAVYPPGGFYKSHFDYTLNDPTGMGYRIATVMFYLSEVEQGGATVFIDLGLTVSPIKGAALFWHNTHSSGENNKHTLHAACPVLLGNKWVANIWIHSYGQEFLHPCKIRGDQIDETLIPAVWKPTISDL